MKHDEGSHSFLWLKSIAEHRQTRLNISDAESLDNFLLVVNEKYAWNRTGNSIIANCEKMFNSSYVSI